MPVNYINGGDWTWWGGRTIQQLVRHGRVADAYCEAQPLVARALRDGFVEWYDIYNRPQGSANSPAPPARWARPW